MRKDRFISTGMARRGVALLYIYVLLTTITLINDCHDAINATHLRRMRNVVVVSFWKKKSYFAVQSQIASAILDCDNTTDQSLNM